MVKRHLALAGILVLLPAFLAFALPVFHYQQVFQVSLLAILTLFLVALVNYFKKQQAEKKSLLSQEDFLKTTLPGITLGWMGCFLLLQVCLIVFR